MPTTTKAQRLRSAKTCTRWQMPTVPSPTSPEVNMGLFSTRAKSVEHVYSHVELLPIKPDVIGIDEFHPDARAEAFREAMQGTPYEDFALEAIFRLSKSIKGELADVHFKSERVGAV